MWTHELLRAKKWKDQPFRYAQRKHDGWRLAVFIQEDGSVKAFGKDQRPHLEYLARYPRLMAERVMQQIADMPPKTSIELEIEVPGKPASFVATALRDPAISITLTPFALPGYMGNELFDAPLEKIEEIMAIYELPFSPYIEPMHPAENMRECLEQGAIERGWEGWILKEANYRGWFKLKLQDTLDGFVTGIVPGKGKYLGQVGALAISQYKDGEAVEVATVSGMTDEQRIDFTTMYVTHKIEGLVVEIKFQEKTENGRLRHPRFSRLRPDKPINECIWGSENE